MKTTEYTKAQDEARANFIEATNAAISAATDMTNALANDKTSADNFVDSAFRWRENIYRARLEWACFVGSSCDYAAFDALHYQRPTEDDAAFFKRHDLSEARNLGRVLLAVAVRIYGDAIPVADLMI